MIKNICNEYIPEDVLCVTPVPTGNINETYLIDTSVGRYVLQHIQKNMDLAKLRFNYKLYSEACETGKILFPKWMNLKTGDYFFIDSENQRWRMYKYLEGDIYSSHLSEDKCYSCGFGIGILHGILKKLPLKPEAVYPHLHDLRYYYEQYLRLLESSDLCEENRDASIEKVITESIPKIMSYKTKYEAVIHGDLKLSNILFRNGSVAGFIDWDTIMTGSIAEEVADCIRSGCMSENGLDKAAAHALINGYRDSSGIGEEILNEIPASFEKICFELALRYYTDAISKNTYFKEKYPGYRKKRATELLNNSVFP